MADETNTGTGDASASSAGGGESGVAAGSAQSGTEATDWKAKYEELERTHAKVTGKAGSTQSNLQTELTNEKAARAAAEAKAAVAEKKLFDVTVMTKVLSQAPEESRGVIEMVAQGILPTITEPDPEKAAEAVLAKINERAPKLVKPPTTVVAVLPHTQNGDAGQPGVAFTPSGKRLF